MSAIGTGLLLIFTVCMVPLFPQGPASGQEVIEPDLKGIATGEGWTVVNRLPTVETVEGVTRVVFDAQIGEASEPCLVVNELTDRIGGRVGLWMGNGSDGDFAELVIKPSGRP